MRRKIIGNSLFAEKEEPEIDPTLIYDCSFINTITDTISGIDATLGKSKYGKIAARTMNQGLYIVNHYNISEFNGILALTFPYHNNIPAIDKFKFTIDIKQAYARNSGPQIYLKASNGYTYGFLAYFGGENPFGNGHTGDSQYHNDITYDANLILNDNLTCYYDWITLEVTGELNKSTNIYNYTVTNKTKGTTTSKTASSSSTATPTQFFRHFADWNSANGTIGYARNIKFWNLTN